MEEKQLNLGKLIDCFQIRNLRLKRVLWMIIGISLIIISLGFGILRLVDTWKEIKIHGRAILLNTLPIPLLLVGIVFPLGVGIIIFAVLHWYDSIKIFTRGLFWHRSKRELIWLWNQTERMDNCVVYSKFAGNAVGVRVTVTLFDRTQNHFTLKNQYERMDELVYQIRQHVVPVLADRAKHKLHRGESILFHKQIKVNNSGVKIREISYPWHALASPRVNKGIITLTTISNKQVVFKSNVNKIENLDLFLHLFENPPKQTI